MTRSRFLSGDLYDGGKLFACVDPDCHHVTPKVQDLRFAATLTPYPDHASATLALETAGAANIEGMSR
jgi:hypothetical protein